MKLEELEPIDPEECFLCKGAGVRWNGDSCGLCKGSGKLKIPAREPSPESVTFLGVLKKTHEKYRCKACSGSGICPKCNGTRKLPGGYGPGDNEGIRCGECEGIKPDDSPGRLSGDLLPQFRPGSFDSEDFHRWNPEIRELLERGAAELEGWKDLGEIEVGLAPQARPTSSSRGGATSPGLCSSCRGTGSGNRKAEERELNALAKQWDEEVRPQLRTRRPGGDPITPLGDPFKLP